MRLPRLHGSRPVPNIRLLALTSLLLLVGCATIQQPHRGHLESSSAAVRDCARWFKTLDRTVARAGVTDIAARRVAGFPYFRVNRWLAALGDSAAQDARVREAWLEHMRRLDAEGRRIEIGNLSPTQVASLEPRDPAALTARAQDCATRLSALDSRDPGSVQLLARRARVEDDYSTTKRVFGLYALTRIPFHAGVSAWQEDVTRTLQAARAGEAPRQPVVAYLPPPIPRFARAQVREILARAARHPLGLPEMSRAERDRLFATYAPSFEIETTGDFDRIGRLFWSGASAPRVDTSRPTVYRRLDFTRFEDRTLLQLVYTAWMPERPRDGAFDVLAGRLDGIVWRVTLAPDGEPVLYDSIHPCGCYHLFFPTPRVEPIPSPRRLEEWAFAPASLPRIKDGSRLVLSLQTRSHYLRDVRPGTPDDGETYRFADYDALRSLALPGGGSRSIFGPDGLVPGTERGERFLFWPMGIANAGAMRQAGTQATAFVGRRHFDDADLVEKRFRLLD